MQHPPGQWSPELVDVHEALTHIVREIIVSRPAAEGLPSFAQQAALSYIGRNPGCRATEIAESFGVHRSTVSRQLRACMDAGWVTAGEGSLHAGYPLTLSAGGRAVLEEVNGHDLARLGERTADWRPGEIADFARALRRFHQPGPTIGDNHA
ncbi:MarR family winged helix-turn-helix transcriptional regulator [Nocardia sp. NPDC051832]|uniref:MarR family winged helix-turn-helix transcriptional regulator n=1 Tax=Nocardia sp. NPDC051832 TaxID=3155673 RepID=UPI00343BF7ED